MREKLTLEEEQFRRDHVFKSLRSAYSQERSKAGEYNKYTLLKEPENVNLGFWAFDHPTNRYKDFVKKHASNNFELIREKCKEDDKLMRKALNRVKPMKLHRVNSQKEVESVTKARLDLKPKGRTELRRVFDLKLDIKLCDMGNACYIDKHYSDVI